MIRTLRDWIELTMLAWRGEISAPGISDVVVHGAGPNNSVASLATGTKPVLGASTQNSYGQRLEDLMGLLGEKSRKNLAGVKVPTVSHPITNKDLTRRST
jgi:hypothetical protein